nr:MULTISPECIES: glycosyltransferase family 39 protein [unclassified Variovorax]
MFAAIWLPHLAQSSLVPPTDNIEQLTWVRSLEWGYYKHPPLPTWVLWLPVQLMGLSGAVTYVLGATFVLVAMGLFWRLLSALRGCVHATVALLAALCITYYNGRLYYYNHEVVLIPFAVASAALTWRAFVSRQRRWWLWLGVCLGVGGLAKYHIAVMAVAVAVFWAWQGGWRDADHRRGLALAAVVSLAVMAPHLYWLWTHDLGPIRYAMESSLGLDLHGMRRLGVCVRWLSDQLLNRALPAWLFLLSLLMFAARARTDAHAPSSAPHEPQPGDAVMSRRLLLCFGLTPLVFTFVLGLAVGADLQLHWGAPFLLLAVPAFMELGRWKEAWYRVSLKSALKSFLLVQLVLLAWGQMISANGEFRLQRHHWRNFDAKALADAVAPAARAQLGGPVRVIAGPPAEAGALALQLGERPLVLIDGRFDISPWVKKDLADECGVLELSKTASNPGYRPAGEKFPGLYWRTVVPRSPSISCTWSAHAAN